MSRILGMGGISYDMVSVLPEMPTWEATEYIQEYEVQQGGMVATAMVAASKLGAEVEYIGGIGNDFQASVMRDNFKKYNVRCERMIVTQGGITPFTFVLVDQKSGRRCLIHKKGVQERAFLTDLPIDLEGVGFLLLDGFYFETALHLAREARKRGLISVCDLSARNADERLPEFLKLIDYPVLSEVFLAHYFPGKEPLIAAKDLLSENNRAIVVTRGETGSWIISKDNLEHIPAFKIKPVDTTGAGDVFHGAFIFSLWKGYGIREAVIFSSAVSALKCQKIGGQAGIPTFEETQQFILSRSPECHNWI